LQKNELLQQTFANQNPLQNARSAHAAEVTTFATLRKTSAKTGKEIFIPVGFLTMSSGGGMPDST
jgi:hypothetical protein